jgi:hypothetical protein
MKKIVASIAIMLFASIGIAAGSDEESDLLGQGRYYDITITNATRGQVITPPVVIVHRYNFRLFEVGLPAIPALATLAEEGMTDPLTGYLDTQSDVYDYVVASDVVPPGESVTLRFRVTGFFRYVTVVGMLASTNDAFFAAEGIPVFGKWIPDTTAIAYDAGSEANSESCDFIPGPPCGMHVHDPAEAEGFVHVHAGIHGIDELDPAELDWRNPVAEMSIQRSR